MDKETRAARIKTPVKYDLVTSGLLRYQDLKSENASSIRIDFLVFFLCVRI